MKYMGSKNRIAKDILPIILKNRNGRVYIEPFCGGLNIIDKVDGIRFASDKNKYLIAMWKGLQNGLERPYTISKELYSEVRTDFNNKTNKFSDFMIGWVGWMGSYNGRFFDGGYSGHEAGKTKRDYISEQIRNTEKQIPFIKDIIFKDGSYFDFDYVNSAVIYCDIPYQETKQYSVSKDFDYDRFWQWVRENSEQHSIFVSEYNAPNDFTCVWEKEVTNAMNTVKTYKPVERLFKYK